MNRVFSHPQYRLRLIAILVLLVGLASSAAIWLTAEDAVVSSMIAEFKLSKLYRHELEAYGGRVTVLADDFMRWVDGLWHGKQLAVTVAVITLLIAAGFLTVAQYLPSDDSIDEKIPATSRKAPAAGIRHTILPSGRYPTCSPRS